MRHAIVIAGALLLHPAEAAAEVLEGWPCAGCVTVTPPAGPDAGVTPRPLLVALHGDGGAVRPIVRAWRAAAAEAGVILLVPECPRALGCKAGSYWQWLASAGHDPGWLGAQIDAVSARFAVDARRVFATGYSGGATYLGWYAPANDTRFAAVAHVAGGAPYRPSCPACKLPVLFVLGAADPMIGPYTRPLRAWYEACGGHEIAWETIPGVTHESILGVLEAGRAKVILAWLLARPAACARAAPSDAGLDASPAPGFPDSGAEPVLPGPGDPAPPPVAVVSPPRVPPAAGCACRHRAGPASPSAVGAFACCLALARRRRRRRRPL